MPDVLSQLLPSLRSHAEEEFNVFDVMRHGTHEKQLSNVFAWLLDAEQTHKLGDAFQRMFIDEVNRNLRDGEPVPYGFYSVRQEQNTSEIDEGKDIADLVLEDHTTTIVVENFYTSSGHGHSYERYSAFGSRDGKRSLVVMLCEVENRSLLVESGWKDAPVVTYADLLRALNEHVERDRKFKDAHPHQVAFFDQMYRRFVEGRRVNDEQVLSFIDAMCATGEARRFGSRPVEDAASSFADHLRAEAFDRFTDSRDVLGRLKQSLRAYGESILKGHINSALGDGHVASASGNLNGIYEWTINFVGPEGSDEPLRRAQIKFGPSAREANEDNPAWEVTVPAAEADYSRLFLTCGREIRQSAVTLGEALEGLVPEDTRLGDELVDLIKSVRVEGSGPDDL